MTVSEAPRVESSARALTIAANASFVPIGIVTVLLGPLLPTLSQRWSLSYEQAGTLFTAQFAASTIGVAFSGWMVSRYSFRFAINVGLLVMAIAVAFLPLASYHSGLICIGAYGAGLGFSVPAGNLLVSEVNPHRRSSALNVVNFSWTTGAVACPFLIAAAFKAHAINQLLLAVGGLLLLVMIGIMLMPSWIKEPTFHAAAGEKSKIDWRGRTFLLIAALFFLYVGVENAVGGWIASYAKSTGKMPLSLAVMTPSFFYFALLCGRWIAPFVLRSVDEIKWARIEILIASAGILGLIVSQDTLGIIASAILAGAGLAPVYPITISLLSREFGSSASRAGSVMFTMANLGGSSIPWLVGFASSRSGSLRVGLSVPLIAAAIVFVVYLSRWTPLAPHPEQT